MTSLTTFVGNSDFVRMLIDAKVEFLVIGGLAVAFHKCRDPLKVDDLDILLEPSTDNIMLAPIRSSPLSPIKKFPFG